MKQIKANNKKQEDTLKEQLQELECLMKQKEELKIRN